MTVPAAGTEAPPGSVLVRASWAGTAVFVAAAAAGAADPDPFESAVTLVAVVLFAVGVVAFLWAFFRAAGRSRTEELSVAGVWFLSGSAPPGVRRALLSSFAVQVVVSVAAASIRPFTEVAFGVLVPVYGLGLSGAWGAAHGTFPPRER